MAACIHRAQESRDFRSTCSLRHFQRRLTHVHVLLQVQARVRQQQLGSRHVVVADCHQQRRHPLWEQTAGVHLGTQGELGNTGHENTTTAAPTLIPGCVSSSRTTATRRCCTLCKHDAWACGMRPTAHEQGRASGAYDEEGGNAVLATAVHVYATARKKLSYHLHHAGGR